VGRYKEAPWDFECPYENKCPYLGISVRHAGRLLSDYESDEYRDGRFCIEAREEIKAKDEYIEKLEAENADLRARRRQEHQSKFKANAKSVRKGYGDGSGKEADGKETKKRGAPVGHPPWKRQKPDHIDKSVNVPAPEICPHCALSGLEPVNEEHIQVQEDIILQPKTLVTKYIHKQAYCPNCRREVFQTAEGELRNCEIGPVAKAAAVYMRHELKLSHRDVQKAFGGLFGMSFTPASSVAFCQKTADQGNRLYEDLRDKIRALAIAHADETFWRIAGMSAYIWYGGDPGIGFFHADTSRAKDVAVSIFGNNFGGGIVADSYAAYNAINAKKRQACLAHLIRKAGDIEQRISLMEKNKQDQQSSLFCAKLSKFFSICCRINQRRMKGKVSFTTAKRHIPRLKRIRDSLCANQLADDDAENLRKRVTDPKRDGDRLFVFLEVNGMQPTNNHAEQSLRLPVIFRKITYGSHSLQGAQALTKNLSLLTTAKRQNKDPVKLFREVLLHGAETPLNLIYDSKNYPQIDSS
jgi:hypothetical protein